MQPVSDIASVGSHPHHERQRSAPLADHKSGAACSPSPPQVARSQEEDFSDAQNSPYTMIPLSTCRMYSAHAGSGSLATLGLVLSPFCYAAVMLPCAHDQRAYCLSGDRAGQSAQLPVRGSGDIHGYPILCVTLRFHTTEYARTARENARIIFYRLYFP